MAQQSNKRDVLFTMKASPSERDQIRAAAKARGITASDLVREGLRLQGALPSK